MYSILCPVGLGSFVTGVKASLPGRLYLCKARKSSIRYEEIVLVRAWLTLRNNPGWINWRET
jgi:hypothetical protein